MHLKHGVPFYLADLGGRETRRESLVLLSELALPTKEKSQCSVFKIYAREKRRRENDSLTGTSPRIRIRICLIANVACIRPMILLLARSQDQP